MNDTNRNSPQASCEKKIIYSCSWHPKLTKIAMCTINGFMFIYDALKGKLLASIQPRKDQSSFKVSWNKLDPRFILLTSADNTILVLGVMDQPKCT